ncbi:MAG: response regulator [Ginsengibacter sp.]
MALKNSHILLIDDNEDILFMMRAMLKLKGYSVSIEENIGNLETSILNLSPDIILMDMLLYGEDGRDICRNLKANEAFSRIPIVMISAHPDAKAECLAAGADYFLEKPFEMKDLYKSVSMVLA